VIVYLFALVVSVEMTAAWAGVRLVAAVAKPVMRQGDVYARVIVPVVNVGMTDVAGHALLDVPVGRRAMVSREGVRRFVHRYVREENVVVMGAEEVVPQDVQQVIFAMKGVVAPRNVIQ